MTVRDVPHTYSNPEWSHTCSNPEWCRKVTIKEFMRMFTYQRRSFAVRYGMFERSTRGKLIGVALFDSLKNGLQSEYVFQAMHGDTTAWRAAARDYELKIVCENIKFHLKQITEYIRTEKEREQLLIFLNKQIIEIEAELGSASTKPPLTKEM